jgi:hypothetical protein
MQHFAKTGNISDISAKENIQETCVTIIGLVCGLLSVELLDGSRTGTWFLFIVLTLIHVIANYLGVACLVLTSLNQYRADIIIDHYSTQNNLLDANPELTSSPAVLSPLQVAAKEPVIDLCNVGRLSKSFQIELGTRLDSVCNSVDGDSLELEYLLFF